MAYEWAKPGAKCVWVDISRDPKYRQHNPRPSKSGEIVTIAAVSKRPDCDFTVIIEGWPNPISDFGPDLGWNIYRFRPIITKTQEQDVEMFLRLASPSPLERLDRLAEELDSLYND